MVKDHPLGSPPVASTTLESDLNIGAPKKCPRTGWGGQNSESLTIVHPEKRPVLSSVVLEIRIISFDSHGLISSNVARMVCMS